MDLRGTECRDEVKMWSWSCFHVFMREQEQERGKASRVPLEEAKISRIFAASAYDECL